jgi:protein-disulfide isomerase
MVYVKEKNALVLTSHAGNTVQIIQLDLVNQFVLSGLPYKGPKNAPVTVVVFSDYQ